MSVWVYLNDSSAAKGVPVSVYSAGGRVGYFNFSIIDAIPFTLYAGPQLNSCSGNIYFSYKPTPQKWTHYTVSWDGSAGNGLSTARLYVDGKFHSSLTQCTPTVAAGSWNAQYIYVGNHANGGSHFTKGLIDEVAIYPNVLTADAIEHIYAGGVRKHTLASND